MSVASMLENMKRRALDSTYDAYISEEYDAWAVESFATEEGEYDAARLELPKVLSSEQMEKLKTMEERYRQNRKYASPSAGTRNRAIRIGSSSLLLFRVLYRRL